VLQIRACLFVFSLLKVNISEQLLGPRIPRLNGQSRPELLDCVIRLVQALVAERQVEMGAGVSGMSRYAVTTELAAGTLAILRVPGWRVRRHFSLVHARDIPLSPPAERFRAILLNELRKLSGPTARRTPRGGALRSSAKPRRARSGGQKAPLTA